MKTYYLGNDEHGKFVKFYLPFPWFKWAFPLTLGFCLGLVFAKYFLAWFITYYY